MAVDLSAPANLPLVKTITLSGTPGNVTKVTIPAGDVSVTLRPVATDCSFSDGSIGLADNTAIGASETFPLPHSTNAEIVFSRHVASRDFFLSSGGASVVVKVLLNRMITPAD